MSPRDLTTSEPPLMLGWHEEHEGDAIVYVNDATGESTMDRCANPECCAPFVARSDRQAACCEACGDAVENAKRRAERGFARTPRVCAFTRCEARARGETFAPVNARQIYCTKRCHMTAQSEAHVPPRRPCLICGVEYQPKNRKARASCDKPECRRAAAAKRFSAWYETHKAHHLSTVISTRKARERRSVAVAVVDTLRAGPASPTEIAARLRLRESTISSALDLLRPALDGDEDRLRLRAGADVARLVAVPKRGRHAKQAEPEQSPDLRVATVEMPPEPQPGAPTTAPSAAPADPWQAPAPSYGTHLPGGAFEVRIVSTRAGIDGPVETVDRIRLEDARTVHAGVSAVLDAGHDVQAPDFSLIPTSVARHGWGVYVASDEAAARIGGASAALRVFDRQGSIRLGARVRLRAPKVSPGPQRVRLDTISPVAIRQSGILNRTYRTPTSSSIISALLTVAKRVGVEVTAEDLRVEIVEHETEPMEIEIGKVGEVRGWSGWAVLVCNGPARWLLEVASRVGLGSRVAFGFGRVFVRDATEDEEPCYDAGPVRDRDRYEELYMLLSPLQRDVLAIFAEAQRRGSRRSTGIEGPLFVTPHAVLRYRERIETTDSYEEALAACIDLASRARRVGPAKPDPDTGEQREVWLSTTLSGETVPIIVGFRSQPHLTTTALPQMVSVYPLDAHEVAEYAALIEQAMPATPAAPAEPIERDAWVLTDRAACDVAALDGCELGEARRRLLTALQEATFVARAGDTETWEHAGRQFRVRDMGEGVGVVERVRAWR